MFAPLFTAERITSDITTNIAKVHTESTATVTRRVVTISRYLNGFLIAMYLSQLLTQDELRSRTYAILRITCLLFPKCYKMSPFSIFAALLSLFVLAVPAALSKDPPRPGTLEGLSLYFAKVSLLRQQKSPEHSTAQLVKLRWNWCWL